MSTTRNQRQTHPIGKPCAHCRRGCKCGAQQMTDGTCWKCGHGNAPYFTRDRRPRSSHNWTREQITFAIRVWARDRGGPPKMEQWRKSTDYHPNAVTVQKLFGTWKNALRSAGYTPPAQGRKPQALAA